MSKELFIGKMNNKDLAEWFGMNIKTFANNKKKKLEELKEYAIFTEVKGKVEIEKIIIPVYVKKEKAYDAVKAHIDENWNENGLDNKISVSEKIYNKREDYHIKAAKSTIYSYTCMGSNELYGSPNDPFNGGEIGTCRYVLCVLDNDTKSPRWFTDEEYKKKKELRKKYFDNLESEELQDTKEAIYLQEKCGDITSKEAAEKIYDLECGIYQNYLEELSGILNGVLIYRIYKKTDYEKTGLNFK